MPLREDIELNGIPLTIYQVNAGETAIPQLGGEQVDYQEEPLVMDTFHLGGFYSWRLIAGTYAYGQNADARFPRLVLPGPFVNSVSLSGATDHVRAMQDYQGDLYIAGGEFIYKAAGGTGAPASVQDLGAGVFATDMETFLGNLYVGTASGVLPSSAPGSLWQNASGAWTSGGGSVQRKYLAQVYYSASAAGYRLVGSDGISTIAYCATAPLTAGSWTTGISIGDTTFGINKLLATSQHVYISKVNGLHDFDGSTGFSPNLMPFWAQTLDNENGLAGVVLDGLVYAGHIRGLYRLQTSGDNAGQMIVCTPGYGLPNETPVRGKITALTSDGGWVVAAIWNGTDTYICYGRDIRQGDAGVSPFGYGVGYGPSPSALGPSPMLWHPGIIYLPGQKCYSLYISGLTTPPRLWFGASPDGGPYKVKWVTLPRSENPLQDVEYQFSNSYSFFIPGQDWGHVATPKNLLQVDVEGDNLGAGSSVAINTNAEQGAYSLFGTANQSPQSKVVGLADFIGRRIGFRLDGTGTTGAGPVLRAIMPRADVRVAVRQVRSYDILLSEGNVDRLGGRDIDVPIETYNALTTLQTMGRVTLRDEFNQTYSVLVEAPIERKMIRKGAESGKGQQNTIQVATLRIKILNGTAARNGLWGSNVWGDGSIWA